MKKILSKDVNNSWLTKAVVLGAVFFVAVLLVKPIGVSTGFSVAAGILHKAIDSSVITESATNNSGYESTNDYYNKNGGELAAQIANPINYEFIFVMAIPFGAYIGYSLRKKKNKSTGGYGLDGNINTREHTHGNNTSGVSIKQFIAPFVGGFLFIFGARMAGGCTSGHMISGIMQSSISGYIFMACVFVVAIPLSIIVGKRFYKQ